MPAVSSMHLIEVRTSRLSPSVVARETFVGGVASGAAVLNDEASGTQRGQSFACGVHGDPECFGDLAGGHRGAQHMEVRVALTGRSGSAGLGWRLDGS